MHIIAVAARLYYSLPIVEPVSYTFYHKGLYSGLGNTKCSLRFTSNPFSLVTNVCVGIRKYIPVGHVCDQ